MKILIAPRGRMATRIAVFALAALATSCLPKTDRLAVFERDVLSQGEVDAMTGHYHRVDGKGKFASIEIAPSTRSVVHRRERGRSGSPSRPRRLASAVFTYKDEGLALFYRATVVFSWIPETTLMLVGVVGDTVEIKVAGKTGLSSARDPKGKTANNFFFMLRKDGKAVTMKNLTDRDKGLAKAVGDPKTDLPVGRVLAYLRAHAEARFLEKDPPTYLRSTPQQRKLVERRIQAALAAADKKARQRRLARKKADAKRTAPPRRSARPPSRDQRPRARPKPPRTKRIGSIDGYFTVTKDAIIELKVRARTKNGGYEYRGLLVTAFEQYGRKSRRGKLVERGYWYPDSQQAYSQSLFVSRASRRCETWGKSTWSHPAVPTTLRLKRFKIQAWRPSVRASRPARRQSKRICIQRDINPRTCSMIRCTKWSNRRPVEEIYLVRSVQDAYRVYNYRFGKF